MKLKCLLFFMLIGGMLNAQDTIRSLVITEAFTGQMFRNYMEITNMGDEPIQLSDFKFGSARDCNFEWNRRDVDGPDYLLQPGESYMLMEFAEWLKDPQEETFDALSRVMIGTPGEWTELADMKSHLRENLYGESRSELDSVSPPDNGYGNFLWGWWGRVAFFVEQQLTDSTAVVVDQVGGVFDSGGCRQHGGMNDSEDVAGFPNATSQGRLIRKFSVKTGNVNFADARGVGVDDSEWMVIPILWSVNRKQPWTLKEHGDFNLDANTLVPTLDGLEVDFEGKTITVPWGLRKPDDIMANMERKPGVAWFYHLNPNLQDSLTYAVKTGDKLEVIVAGIDLDRDTFDIVVSDPTSSDNIVVPGIKWDAEGEYRDDIKNSFTEWPVVTRNESGMDTIRGYKTQHYENIPNPDYYYGIPFATRVDTLFKLLEKPSNATWEIVWVDGEKRADLKNGDKLKVTAEDGSVKEYYIYVDDYIASSNAQLSAITWPDIPDFYRGIFGWVGDTIPGFEPFATDYIIQVPLDVDGIPALTAKTANNNATVEVNRAANLSGSLEDQSIQFKVVAEDDTTVVDYEVLLQKEKLPQNIEPHNAEPFISKMIVQQQYGNDYMEICNPGNQPLDMSNYMFAEVYGNSDPAAAIAAVSEPDDWMNRYRKYVPGYKWVDQSEWATNPGILTQDLAVNSLVMPGDVFVMGNINTDGILSGIDPNYNWTVPQKLDVQFRNTDGNLRNYRNPWGEDVGAEFFPGWHGDCIFMFKILNDSVKSGLKPANDPEDFQLVDTWGMPDGSKWAFSDPETDAYGNANISSWVRRPQFNTPDSIFGASFGVVGDSICEWDRHDDDYWLSVGIPAPLHRAYAANELGSHYFKPPTEFMSTIGSNLYKVSDGYGPGQEISGVVAGTMATEFLGNIIKYNEGQNLTLKTELGGAQLASDAEVATGNVLVVMSADSANTTEYAIQVSESGLSSNALLTSNRYEINIEEEPKSAADGHLNIGTGIVTGFEYGTQLKTVLRNVDVPAGASLTVIDGNGAYVPTKVLNYDTVYVDVTVNTDTYFEVVAEDFVTRIIYQLAPVASEDDAFLTSDVYTVDQGDLLIQNVPGGEYAPGGGTAVSSFLANLVPSKGASLMVVDKTGRERTTGKIYRDDKVVVTSPSGTNTSVYYIAFQTNSVLKEINYLAYVLSDAYAVNQVDYIISGPTGSTLLSDFYNRIEAAEGATAMVVDADGNEKTDGDLDDGDMLKVTSADGMMTVMYELNLDLTPTDLVDAGNIKLYPNPTDGKINISGLEKGGWIKVFSPSGVVIRDISVDGNLETVSLSNQPAGMYLIVISDAHQQVGRYKVIRK